MLELPLIESMKFLDADAKARRISTDFIKRDQPVVAVERGVFDPLRRHRASQLLQPHDKLGAFIASRFIDPLWKFDHEQAANKIKDRSVKLWRSQPSLLNGGFDVGTLGCRKLARLACRVNAIDWKARNNFP